MPGTDLSHAELVHFEYLYVFDPVFHANIHLILHAFWWLGCLRKAVVA